MCLDVRLNRCSSQTVQYHHLFSFFSSSFPLRRPTSPGCALSTSPPPSCPVRGRSRATSTAWRSSRAVRSSCRTTTTWSTAAAPASSAQVKAGPLLCTPVIKCVSPYVCWGTVFLQEKQKNNNRRGASLKAFSWHLVAHLSTGRAQTFWQTQRPLCVYCGLWSSGERGLVTIITTTTPVFAVQWDTCAPRSMSWEMMWGGGAVLSFCWIEGSRTGRTAGHFNSPVARWIIKKIQFCSLAKRLKKVKSVF